MTALETFDRPVIRGAISTSSKTAGRASVQATRNSPTCYACCAWPRLAGRRRGLTIIPKKGEETKSGTHTTGIWISANSATVLRWSPEVSVRHRIVSTVPGHHRSTGRPPTEKHPAGEGHRDEHMRTFFDEVARALPADDDLLLVGDGEVV